MLSHTLVTFLLFILLTLAASVPLASYIARVFAHEKTWADIVMGRIEYGIALLAGPSMSRQQTWAGYLGSLLLLHFFGIAVLFGLLVVQDKLPFNPQGFAGVEPLLAFNIAVSFATNTDWQAYGGESTLSYFSQTVGLCVQNFLSAATGIAVAFALMRGFTRRESPLLGNFYADTVRAALYIILPLSLLFAVVFAVQGAPQNFMSYVQALPLEGGQQIIPQGPVASQVAVKLIGSNGGGFFAANSAHPYENPTALTALLSLVAMMLLPVSLVIAFGKLVGDKRQGWALFAAMTLLLVALAAATIGFERMPNPALHDLGIDMRPSAQNIGGNLEGKEARFGVGLSALWAAVTSTTANGSVNAAMDSLMPLASIPPLLGMLLGEVVFGGVGSGLCGMLLYVLLTVFIAGLMIGRTPEYLGKKIDLREVKLAVFAMLLYPACVLGLSALALMLPGGATAVGADGAHGLTQMIYAYASAAANNGSAFAGFNGDTPYQNISLAVAMLVGRLGILAPVLAIAGSLAAKRTVPSSVGTLPTHGPTFVFLLVGVIVMFGGLTYFPVLALGPVAEHLSLFVR